MNSVWKLALFGLAAVAVFAVMFAAGSALVPESTVETWNQKVEQERGSHTDEPPLTTHSSDEGNQP